MKLQPTQFGKYLLLDRIGVGGMAEIFRARQFGIAGFQKQLVIKRILRHLADNDEFIRMFIDEAKIAVSLHHANVVQIFDLGSVNKEYFIAMEYVLGKDLLNLLIRCTHLRIRVPQKLAVFIIAEALKGLEAAHNAIDSRGNPLHIIHRDVSPSNVLISYDGEVKIGDFGVAKAARRESDTRSGTMKGKLGYMSPEQVTGVAIDHRADLFSAGIMLYEMLAMNRLFHGKTELETMMLVRDSDVGAAVNELPHGVGEPLKVILRRALARAPGERFQSATEFLDALLDHLFNEKLRVTSQDMGRFMKSVFAKEIEEEKAHQAEVDRVAAEMAPSAPSGVMPLPNLQTPVATPTGHRTVVGFNPASKFRMQGADGIIYGPMERNTLVEIINRDGLVGSEKLSIDGQPWLPPSQFKALIERLNAEAAAGTEADFTGTFTRLDLPRLLYRYAACRSAGRLHLETGTKRKDIYWRRGRPEYVTSNLRSELLGEYLVERRLISRHRLNEALVKLTEFDGRLGDTLLQMKLLTPHDLFNALSAQVRAKLIEVFSWERGSYGFFANDHTDAQIVPFELGAYALINEGVCRRMALDDIKAHFDGREHLPFHRLDHQIINPEQVKLSTKQARVWNAVGHGHPISEQFGRLVSIPGVDEADVYQVLFLMERLEFATFETE